MNSLYVTIYTKAVRQSYVMLLVSSLFCRMKFALTLSYKLETFRSNVLNQQKNDFGIYTLQ